MQGSVLAIGPCKFVVAQATGRVKMALTLSQFVGLFVCGAALKNYFLNSRYEC